MNIYAPDLYTGWVILLQMLHDAGMIVKPRGYETREFTGISLHIQDLRQNILVHPARNLMYKFMVAEWFWIMAGIDTLRPIYQYNPIMRAFSDDDKVLAGAYGPRLKDQIPWVLDQLRRFPETRQAIASIWTPNPRMSKDIPCTIALQWLRRDEKLDCIATMRSSDVWLGLPYDVFVFSQITNAMAGELGIMTGGLLMQLGSSHLYEFDYQGAGDLLLKKSEGSTLISPKLDHYPDPTWSEHILCQQILPPGIISNSWLNYKDVLLQSSNTKALEVLRELSETT